MNEEMMTTGTANGAAGFSDKADHTGPNAGLSPILKFRKKIKDQLQIAKRKKLKEGIEMKNGLFQYKVSLPEVGETILYANNPSELRQKLRLLINYRYRGDIKIERIMRGDAGKFFMDKRAKHLRNESTDQKQMQAQLTRQKHTLEKKKANLKIQMIRKQLQKKTSQLKAKGRVGGNTQDYNK